ncbi:MAG: phosphoribosylaminoimidazolesuccinocarboxamide synthase [Spirochaetaceae bacterium]|jgi:phosphoribosylaminoimidazole-succinocarboxamide synthase|nr:phosphoribosylaminoimidazolesuccinocarboxamide synthase [Spirochaetaceae bacterium]
MSGKYRKLEKLYEGKAKKVFRTDAEDVYIVEYKDDATAGNGAKKGVIQGKGAINNRVSNHLMRLLEGKGIPTHFIEELGATETAVRRLSIVPLEVIVRNIAAGSLAARLGLSEGTKLRSTVLEYCYKDDALGDPMVNEYHIAAMGWASPAELKTIAALSFKINDALGEYLKDAGIELIDFKLEFGRPVASKQGVQSEKGGGLTSDLPAGGEIILADEISPDTCRFWDTKTGEKLDKDRFRRDLGGVEDAYNEVMRRLLGRD